MTPLRPIASRARALLSRLTSDVGPNRDQGAAMTSSRQGSSATGCPWGLKPVFARYLTESTISVDNGTISARRRGGPVVAEAQLERRVAVVRSFNRFHTRRLACCRKAI